MRQNYRNHRRYVPLFHFGLSTLILTTLLYSIYRLLREPSLAAGMGVAVTVSLALLFYYARDFALTVQDRVIRLEMRLRLHQVLPEDLRTRIDDISTDHLIGLRFAADAELPELVRKALDGTLATRDQIKRAVRDWQPDEERC